LGTLAVVALVALRLGIGWHFFREGTDKIQDPSWTAAHFFTGSKGPLRPLFELLVWDVDGKVRLNYSQTEGKWPKIDPERTLAIWDQYRVRVADHYGFDDKQQKQASACLKRWEEQLKWYLDSNEEKILEYFHGLDRQAANRADAAKRQVASLRGQAGQIEAELVGARGPWLAQVGQLWAGYDEAINAIATSEQRQRGGLTIGKPAPGFLNTNLIDRVIPWFDAVVGVLLIVGLFTRVAALAGAGFLFSIILTQWPGAPGALPVYYQTIEMLGMLVLAAVAAGQFAGLDLVLYSYWSRYTQSKQETNP
jgi:uncharacterized membrane protein YphA (DoxX/SURF4 family)